MRFRAPPLLLLAFLCSSGVAGCYGAASSLNSGLSSSFSELFAIVASIFGLLGVGLGFAAAKNPVAWTTLVACWLVGAPVLLLTAVGTELFWPWPGTFNEDDLLLFWLPQPLAAAPLIATWCFLVERKTASRRARRAWPVPCAIYAGLLAIASARGYVRPPIEGTIVDIAVLDDVELQRSDKGMVTVWGHALPGRYRKLRAGTQLALAIDDAGGLLELRSPPHERPIRVHTDGHVVDIAAASTIGCFITRSGAWCFDPVPDSKTGFGRVPVPIEGLQSAVDLGMSWNILCGIEPKGRVVCARIQGSPTRPLETDRIREIVPSGAAGVAVAGDRICVLAEDRRVLCTSVEAAERAEPGVGASDVGPIANLNAVVEIVAGTFHVCARQQDGGVSCWGGNGWGQLGPDVTGESATPAKVALPSPAVALFGHHTSTCARLETGEIFCWGAQKEPGAAFGGRVCAEPWFGPPTVCSAEPKRIVLSTTAIPFRDRRR